MPHVVRELASLQCPQLANESKGYHMADPITPDQFKEQVLESDLPVLIDFFATWCGPCRMMAPVIEQIAQEQEGTIKVIQVDVDENGSLAQACGVVSVPTFVALKDGKIVGRTVGAQAKESILAMFA